MPICVQCGERNLDSAPNCVKCGASLSQHLRARADARQLMVWAVIRRVVTVIALVAVACCIMPAYKASFTAYYRYRLNTVREAAIKSCGENPQYSQKDQLDACLAADDNLTKAQADFDSFTGANKTK